MSITTVRRLKVTHQTLYNAMLEQNIGTFDKLAERAGIDRHTITRGLQNGFSQVSLSKIAEAMNIKASELVEKI